VLFLDIQMPGMNGFEPLDRVARDLPVIFTTAYESSTSASCTSWRRTSTAG
jgi:CheY-like chemotaxis protein